MLMSLLMVAGVNRPRVLGLVAVALLATGCATSSGLRRAAAAEQRQDYDIAVAEYTNVLRQHPDDAGARQALERAKLRASSDHLQAARRLAATGKLEQALVEYELALELNPTNSEIDTALRDVRSQLRTKVAVARQGKTELQTLIERARDTMAQEK